MYLHHLFQYIKNDKKLPRPIHSALRSKYSIPSGNTLCINEIIAMCLYFNKYRIDVQDLSHDTKEEPKLYEYFLKPRNNTFI